MTTHKGRGKTCEPDVKAIVERLKVAQVLEGLEYEWEGIKFVTTDLKENVVATISQLTAERDYNRTYWMDSKAEAEAKLEAAEKRVKELEAERDALREFAESFHVTVVQDSFYKDVTLHLDKPHSLSIRIRNDSSKSWIFTEFEERRTAAIKSSPSQSTIEAEFAENRVKELEAGIKRLSDEEELLAETTDGDIFSMVSLAAKLAASEHREKELKVRIEQLKSELEEADDTPAWDALKLAQESNKLLSERVAVLEGALEPFVAFVNALSVMRPGWDHDDFIVFIGENNLTLAPFRRARTSLEGK